MKFLVFLLILVLFVSTAWSFSIFKDNSKDKLEEVKDLSSNDIRKQLNSIKVDKKAPGFSPSQVKCE